MQGSALIGGADAVGSRRGVLVRSAQKPVSAVVALCEACGQKLRGTLVLSGVVTYCSLECARIDQARIPGNYLG
jgi:hypothetical protein